MLHSFCINSRGVVVVWGFHLCFICFVWAAQNVNDSYDGLYNSLSIIHPCLDHFDLAVLCCALFTSVRWWWWREVQNVTVYTIFCQPFRIAWLCILLPFAFSFSLLYFLRSIPTFFPSSFLLLILNWWCTILIAVYGRLYCAFLFHCIASMDCSFFLFEGRRIQQNVRRIERRMRERQQRNGKSNKHFDFKHIENFCCCCWAHQCILSDRIYHSIHFCSFGWLAGRVFPAHGKKKL